MTITAARPSFTLRRGASDDAEQVSRLIGTTWAKFFAYSVTPEDLEDYLNGPVSVGQIRRDLDHPEMRFLVATTPSDRGMAENIIGVAQLVLHTTEPCLTLPKPVELRRLYLDAEYHGGGAGAALMRGAEALAKGEGWESMWLGVWEHNLRGKKFYGKMGFGVVGEHKFLVGESVRRDWVMEKGL
jgi:ribosomal protein S18 acetylase RimI-like enzyme